LLKQRKIEKEKAEIEEQKELERKRREEGKSILEGKQSREEQERLEIIKERKQQDINDKKALSRLREQIKADRYNKCDGQINQMHCREEKKAKHEALKDEQAIEIDERRRQKLLEADEKRAAEIAARRCALLFYKNITKILNCSSIARILLRFPDGSTVDLTFEPDQTLADIVEWIDKVCVRACLQYYKIAHCRIVHVVHFRCHKHIHDATL
jgi:hypothetical protein